MSGHAWRIATVVLCSATVGCGLFRPNTQASPLARWWGPPETGPGTLGVSLEHRFQNMLLSCRVDRLDDSARSAIPAILQQSFDSVLKHQVVRIDGQSSWNLFRFVSHSPQLTLTGSTDFNDYLSDASIPQFVLPRPDPGSSSIYYKQSCSSVVHAAISSSLKVPSATVKAALGNNFENHTQLAIVQGRFFSPLSILLSPSVPRASRLRTLLGIWLWYSSRRDAAGPGSNYYLAGFNGVALYNLRQSAAKLEGSLQARAGIAIPLLSADADFSGELTAEASANVESFETYLFPAPASDPLKRSEPGQIAYQVEQLPTPAEIAADWADVNPRLVEDREDTVHVGFPHRFLRTYQVREIPTALCGPEHWRSRQSGGTRPQFVMTAIGDTACKVDLAVTWEPDYASAYTYDPIYDPLAVLEFAEKITDTVSGRPLLLNFPFPRVVLEGPTEIAGRLDPLKRPDGDSPPVSWTLTVRASALQSREIAWQGIGVEIAEKAFISCDGPYVPAESASGSAASSVNATVNDMVVEKDTTVLRAEVQAPYRASFADCRLYLTLRVPLVKPFEGASTMRRFIYVGGIPSLPLPAKAPR